MSLDIVTWGLGPIGAVESADGHLSPLVANEAGPEPYAMIRSDGSN